MKIRFTTKDGCKGVNYICDHNLEKYKKKYPDLEILENSLIPYQDDKNKSN